ncbi:MAG: hypothetical protein K0S39_46 [Paenibacillus sp.]|jgi:uncharacterized protein (DUF2252 family)|nr:hypothetical protein [Paenibacillus sp.]
MVTDWMERVKRTQKSLRLHTVSQVLDEFDVHIMGLDHAKRMRKYEKMAQSPFSFYRGSGYLFYFDVSRVWIPYHSSPDRPTWIQGDLHFENFGAFRSESGRIVYDVNDFDEGYAGSYLYDILRMSVSIVLVCRLNGIDLPVQKEALNTYIKAYAGQIERFAKRKEEPGSLVFDVNETEGPVRKLLKKLEKRAASHLLEGSTALVEGRRRFQWSEELQQPTEEERAMVMAGWADYISTLDPRTKQSDAYYTIKDIAVKHGSGTASIGLDRYYVLIEGKGSNHEPDDRIIEIKEVRAPVPAYFMPYNERFWEQYAHQGKRVIMTQKAMHHEADPFLGYLTMDGRQFYARERSPFKKKLKPAKLEDAADWLSVLECMGKITAKMHARADADVEDGILSYHSEDEIMRAIGGDTGSFREYTANWALAYAHRVEEDYELFLEWLAGMKEPKVEV